MQLVKSRLFDFLDIYGLSDHDLMFSKEAVNTEADMQAEQDYISQRVI